MDKWRIDEIKRLIISFEKKPELWNKSCGDYRNRYKRENSIKELCDEFDRDREDILKKIKNLRTHFHSELMKQKKSLDESGIETYKTSWEYFELLRFLEKNLKECDSNSKYNLVILRNKRVWRTDEIKRLIFSFEKKTELWNKSCGDYRNRYKRENSIKELCDEFDRDREDILKKIKNLRRHFHSEVMKQKKSSDESGIETYKTSWEYFELLRFLEEHLKECDSYSKYNSQNTQTFQQNAESLDEYQNDNGVCQFLFPTTSSSTKITSTRKRSRKTEATEIEDNLITKVCNIITKAETGSDEVSIFGKFVASRLRNLDPDLRSSAERKMQRILLNHEDMQADRI